MKNFRFSGTVNEKVRDGYSLRSSVLGRLAVCVTAALTFLVGHVNSARGSSPDRTLVPPASQIVDLNGGVWTIGAGNTILLNGTGAGGRSGTIIFCRKNAIYVYGTDSQWYQLAGDPTNVYWNYVAYNPVTAPQAPTIRLAAPISGQTYVAPASVTLSAVAAAQNSGGSVSSVAFHHGSVLLGTVTSSPYSVTWDNVGAGDYTVTATVTDNLGLTATGTVNITVTAAGPPAPGTFTMQPLTQKSLSTYHIGNSVCSDFIAWWPSLAAAYQRSIGGTFQFGQHFRSATALTNMYANPTLPGTQSFLATGLGDNRWWNVGQPGFVPWTKVLPNNRFDVVTLQPWQDDSKATLQGDTDAINALIKITQSLSSNASTRFYVYAPWGDCIYDDLTNWANRYTTPTADTPGTLSVATRGYQRAVVRSVRKTNPQVGLIPAGEVLLALDVAMRAGRFQQFSSIQDLHRDIIHLNWVGQLAAAYTVYATIFQKSPVGLPNVVGDSKASTNNCIAPFTAPTSISAADLLLMQQIVWATVTSPELQFYTGVNGLPSR